MEEDSELITSPLSRTLTEDGVTVELVIYRRSDATGWVLEVRCQGGCTAWEDPFATEQDALDEALDAIASDGIASFQLGAP